MENGHIDTKCTKQLQYMVYTFPYPGFKFTQN